MVPGTFLLSVPEVLLLSVIMYVPLTADIPEFFCDIMSVPAPHNKIYLMFPAESASVPVPHKTQPVPVPWKVWKLLQINPDNDCCRYPHDIFDWHIRISFQTCNSDCPVPAAFETKSDHSLPDVLHIAQILLSLQRNNKSPLPRVYPPHTNLLLPSNLPTAVLFWSFHPFFSPFL